MSDLQAELLGVVEHAIANHPRSLQVAAGPSELGHPCKARLAYKFAGAPEVNPNRRTPWKPIVADDAVPDDLLAEGERRARPDDPKE